MAQQAFGLDIDAVIAAARRAAWGWTNATIPLGSGTFSLPAPFPSPIDWRDRPIYFLLIDRFCNPSVPPRQIWNQVTTARQGGAFAGVTARLPYLKSLGVGAIWLSPVLKNPCEAANMSYPGYATQDFLNLEARFASDGTVETAEVEYRALVDAAHGLGLHVIQDIVINHSARVFDYLIGGQLQADPAFIGAPPGQEPSIEWLDGAAVPQAKWTDAIQRWVAGPDDAVWPLELQDRVFFRRQGDKASDAPGPGGFVAGDFGTMRQLVAEYDATPTSQEAYRDKYGSSPVLAILARSYSYLIAKYGIDGLRIDTVKYVRPDIVAGFCDAVRETALSVGKANFFAFGEIWDTEDTIDRFVGRHSTAVDSGGLDAALDYPLFNCLPNAIKGFLPVESVAAMYAAREAAVTDLVCSHADAGAYFVTFLDNHDQNQRIHHPSTPLAQVTQAIGCLYALQGIPCLYYGTEQGFTGTVDATGAPSLTCLESVREALWGAPDAGADASHPVYLQIKTLLRVRAAVPALRYGRQYFRAISGDGETFGMSQGLGGVIAFSRILGDTEVAVVANTSQATPFTGWVLLDRDLNRSERTFFVLYSNLQGSGSQSTEVRNAVVLGGIGPETLTTVAAVRVSVQPMEVQIIGELDPKTLPP